MPRDGNPPEYINYMSAPHAGEIPNLNLLLGGFADWGLSKWATVQDIVVRSSMSIDIVEAEILAKQLLQDKYIEVAYKNGREYEYVEPGKSGLQTGHERIPGYALTRLGRQIHLDGGYKLSSSPPTPLPAAINPNMKPPIPANTKPTTWATLRAWLKGHPFKAMGAVALVVFGVWLPANWDGHFTKRSMKGLFGMDTSSVEVIDTTSHTSTIDTLSSKTALP